MVHKSQMNYQIYYFQKLKQQNLFAENYINILSSLDFFNNSNLIFNKSLEMIVKDKRIGSNKYELSPLSLKTFSNFEPTYQKRRFVKVFKLRHLISKVVNRQAILKDYLESNTPIESNFFFLIVFIISRYETTHTSRTIIG